MVVGVDPVAKLRAELTSWLDDHLDEELAEISHGHPSAANLERWREWNRVLADAGWAAPSWPTRYGGRDADLDEQLAYLEITSARGMPGPVNVIGVSNIAPAIMAEGTDGQRARFLGPMLRGDQIWSQGMSEPEAGSDLASLRTAAVRDGDHFVVSGQKTWNSLGHLADWCQLYVRTDPDAPRHRGISCLLVDLRTPGIEARPIRTITGDEPFSELFLDEARIPVSALLGPLNEGWRVAMTTLSFERAGVARLHLTLSRRLGALLADPAVADALRDRDRRDQVASVWSDLACLRLLCERSFAAARRGQPTGTMASLVKLAWGRADQRLAGLATDLVGIGAVAGEPGADLRWATNLASSRQSTIAGGTTEINKSIVAEHGLGLPR